MTQLTLSAKQSNTTKISLFFANFERESNLFDEFKKYRSAQAAIKKVNILKRIYENIIKMQKNSTNYKKKKEKMTSQLKKGDKVYLLTKNLKYKKENRKRSRKLDNVKIELFFIKASKKAINYELNLSQDVKIHSIFHISLLESVDSSTSI